MEGVKISKARRRVGPLSAYAYFVKACWEQHKKRHPDETFGYVDFCRLCAQHWKIMSNERKKRFIKMADEDKKTFRQDIQDCIPTLSEKIDTKLNMIKHHDDVPKPPKNPLTAFFCFSNCERAKVKEMYPGIGAIEIAKELGRLWSAKGVVAKKKYFAIAMKDRGRFQKEREAYWSRKNLEVPVPIQVQAEPVSENGVEYEH